MGSETFLNQLDQVKKLFDEMEACNFAVRNDVHTEFITLCVTTVERIAGSGSLYASQLRRVLEARAMTLNYAAPELFGIVKALRRDVENSFLAPHSELTSGESCFISYSHKDEGFARRLYDRMRGEKLRVWFAPEDMQGGQKLIEQIDRAIQVNDRLLLVLSEHSMNSEWVKTEIRKTHHAELRLPKSSETSEVFSRQKLFPIRLVSIDRIRAWSCFDADTGKDLAVELREYHIPDFSNWKNHDAFESAFADLLRDLRAQA